MKHKAKNTPYRRRNTVAIAALACIPLLVGCWRAEPLRPVPAHETLLTVIADYRRFSETDIYRHGMPKDISGQNAFRATLERLEYFEQSNPGRDTDVVSFTRAETYARLGDFSRAVESFANVSSQSPLYGKSQERSARLLLLRDATKRSPTADQLNTYLADLERQQKSLKELTTQFSGTYDAILARRELERVEREYALTLFRNRYVVDKGATRALEFLRGMIQRHKASHLLHSHQMMLGQFYLELAQDLTVLTSPDKLGFDHALFRTLVNSAQEQFALVSQADGYPEKLEGAAMLRLLEALTRRVEGEAEVSLPTGSSPTPPADQRPD